MAKKKTLSKRNVVPMGTGVPGTALRALRKNGGDRPLKNVESFGAAVRGVRNALKGTELEEIFDSALKKRKLLKGGKLKGRAAQ